MAKSPPTDALPETDPSETPESRQGFDVLLDEAEDIARRLEDGDLPLEEALRLYEIGVARLRQGSAALARTEKKLKVLMEEAGGFRLEDLDEEEPDNRPSADPL